MIATPTNESDLLVPKEVAAELRCSTMTVYRMIKAKELTAQRIRGRLLVSRQALRRRYPALYGTQNPLPTIPSR